MLEFARRVQTRLTVDGYNTAPVWSPDGNRVLFASGRRGILNLYAKSASGAGNEELVLETPESKFPEDWSHDGQFILYQSAGTNTSLDLWVMPVTGDRKPFPVVQSRFQERQGQFSPDGKWIAYTSDETGQAQIYVQSFPKASGKWQISVNGGVQPRWRGDGKEILYISPGNQLMAASIRVAANGEAVEPGTPVMLFAAQLPENASDPNNRHQYVVSSDGQRFLIRHLLQRQGDAAPPITVLLNWKGARGGGESEK